MVRAARVSIPAKTIAAPPVLRQAGRGKVGRPAAGREDVETRLLDAATTLFIERGFEATTCEQVAASANAGKASLYARYANKEALLAAVIGRMIDRKLAPAGRIDARRSLRERLEIVARSILEHTMQPEAVGLMRLVIAEAPRIPELAQEVDRIGWEAGVRRVAEALSARRPSEAAITEAWPAAARFIELVFVPHQMRVLLGDSAISLEAGARRRIASAIDVLDKTNLLAPWM